MKKLLVGLAFLSLTVPSLAHSKQLVTSLFCDTSFNVFELLRKADERLMFTGDTLVRGTDGMMYPAGLYIWMNLETKTSSVTVMFPDLTTCLLAPVKNMQGYDGEQPWEIPKDEL